MWIQDLFLDAFDGTHDLAWDHLSEPLHAARVVSSADADTLVVSVMEMLGHAPAPRSVEKQIGRRCGGSMILRHGLATLDVCRLPAREAGRWEAWQILPSDQDQTDALTALKSLASLPAGLSWSLCCDLMSPAHRLALWRRTGLWDRLAVQVATREPEQPATRGSTSESNAPTRIEVTHRELAKWEPRPEQKPEPERVALSNRLIESQPAPAINAPTINAPTNPEDAFWLDLESRYPQWRKSLLNSLRDAEGSDRTNLPHSTSDAGRENPTDTSVAAHRKAARDEYLEAKQQWINSEARRAELQRRWTELQSDAEAWELAESVAEMWAESTRLIQTTVPENVVTEPDVAALRKLDQQLAHVRRRMKECRAAQEARATQQVSSEKRSSRELLRSDLRRDLESLLERWDDWSRQESESSRESDGEASDAASDARVVRMAHGGGATGEAGEASVLRQLRQLSQRWREARRELEEARRALAADELPQDTAASFSSDVGSTGIEDKSLHDRRESLQRQIRQLRDETRLLLARQLLSRPALMGIGFLFSIGVATLLAALLLDLQGAQMAAGAVGITCILTALLLKASFERAPTDELRQQRLRVEQLLKELHELPLPWEAMLAERLNEAAAIAASDEAEAEAARLAMLDANSSPDDFADSTRTGDEPHEAMSAKRWPTIARFSATNEASERLAESQRAVEEALEDWQRFLAKQELPIDASPAEALRMVQHRRRSTRSQRLDAIRAVRDESQARAAQQRRILERWCRDAADWWNAQDPSNEPCPVDECTPQQWRDRLRRELACFIENESLASHASAPRQTSQEEEAIRVELEELQQRLKQLKRRRQKLCERTGVSQVVELEAALEEHARLLAARSEGESMRRELELLLSESPHGHRVTEWLDESPDITARLEIHRQRLQDVRTELARIDAQQREWREEIQTWASERPTWDASHTQAMHPDGRAGSRAVALAGAWQLDLIKAIADGVRRRREDTWRRLHPPVSAMEPPLAAEFQPVVAPELQVREELPVELPVEIHSTERFAAVESPKSAAAATGSVRRALPLRPLLRATSWLRSVTGQRDLQLHLELRQDFRGSPEYQEHAEPEHATNARSVDEIWDEIVWSDERRGDRTLAQMPKAQRHLVVLCLQLALAEELKAEMGSPPWIFTDRSLGMPDRMVQRWIERLAELAADGHQILLVTSRTDVVQWCEERRIPVLQTASHGLAEEPRIPLMVPELPMLDVELPVGPARPALVSPGELVDLDDDLTPLLPEPWKTDRHSPFSAPIAESVSASPPVYTPPFVTPRNEFTPSLPPVPEVLRAVDAPRSFEAPKSFEPSMLEANLERAKVSVPKLEGTLAGVAPTLVSVPPVANVSFARVQPMVEPPVLQPSVVVVRPAFESPPAAPTTFLQPMSVPSEEAIAEAAPPRDPLAARRVPEKKYEVVEVAWERAG